MTTNTSPSARAAQLAPVAHADARHPGRGGAPGARRRWRP